jgi:hypothetical protein
VLGRRLKPAGLSLAVVVAVAVVVGPGTAGAITSGNAPRADLQAKFTSYPKTLAVGGKGKFKFRMRNAGPDLVAMAEALITVPPGMRYIHATGGQCTYGKAGPNMLDCRHGNLAPGHSAVVRFVLKAGKTGKRRVTGFAGDSAPADPRIANNTAKAVVRVHRRP